MYINVYILNRYKERHIRNKNEVFMQFKLAQKSRKMAVNLWAKMIILIPLLTILWNQPKLPG